MEVISELRNIFLYTSKRCPKKPKRGANCCWPTGIPKSRYFAISNKIHTSYTTFNVTTCLRKSFLLQYWVWKPCQVSRLFHNCNPQHSIISCALRLPPPHLMFLHICIQCLDLPLQKIKEMSTKKESHILPLKNLHAYNILIQYTYVKTRHYWVLKQGCSFSYVQEHFLTTQILFLRDLNIYLILIIWFLNQKYNKGFIYAALDNLLLSTLVVTQ